MSEPVNLQLEYRDDCLVIWTHRRDILERMPATMQAIANAIRAKPVRATLLDVCAVPGNVTFLDRYQMGNMAGRHLPRVLLAVLMRAEQADPKASASSRPRTAASTSRSSPTRPRPRRG